ncbi:unnamed protein product [Didymodactylos carnosus]|uniref:Uncharacterized protein n=1 Tax=Didymodactylos carnosus TaxID=1234261 RepID=A0A814SPC6_9BILA|nr:unnamed protein product [Didymodactylos carnosus]CAF1150792.1 unnamed protein product [Didymodactylos carnosus]CAF3816927.1 unnamed protein product [Didymodactylos carnosus]CAF3914348.1 unnamed protein product [Didymodactylos carnosus]
MISQRVPWEKKSTISATTVVPDLNISEWDKDTSISLNGINSLLPPLNTSVCDHNATIHMDLSGASESTIEVVTTSVSPQAAICNALLSMRPSVIQQPPTKKVVLGRQAEQLLTCEEALPQMREKEERAAKKATPVQKRTSVKEKRIPKQRNCAQLKMLVLEQFVKDDALTGVHNRMSFLALNSKQGAARSQHVKEIDRSLNQPAIHHLQIIAHLIGKVEYRLSKKPFDSHSEKKDVCHKFIIKARKTIQELFITNAVKRNEFGTPVLYVELDTCIQQSYSLWQEGTVVEKSKNGSYLKEPIPKDPAERIEFEKRLDKHNLSLTVFQRSYELSVNPLKSTISSRFINHYTASSNLPKYVSEFHKYKHNADMMKKINELLIDEQIRSIQGSNGVQYEIRPNPIQFFNQQSPSNSSIATIGQDGSPLALNASSAHTDQTQQFHLLDTPSRTTTISPSTTSRHSHHSSVRNRLL